jgi:hypothetical protein
MTMDPCTVYGDVSEGVLERRLIIARQSHAETNICEDMHLSVRQMLNYKFIYHRCGEKNGFALLQGSCPGGIRGVEKMASLDTMMIDVDTGLDRDVICERLQATGWFGVIWSTHSHETCRSVVKGAALARWAGEGYKPCDAVQWLAEYKHYEPAVLDGATVEVGEEGRFIVHHRPMDKSRLLLVLSETFVISGEEDRTRWANLYRGVCHRLGDLPYDPSCLDVSRIMFEPRHPPESRDHAIIVFGGDLLDLGTIEPVAESPAVEDRFRHDPDNLFRTAAYSLGMSSTGDAPHIKNKVDQYLIDHRKGLQFAALYGDYQEGSKPRRNGSRAGVCPWAELHSDPDDDDDTGFWCTDADPERYRTYKCACRHAGCSAKSHDAFWYASKFCDDHPEITTGILEEYTL